MSRRLFVRAFGPTGMRWDEPTAADVVEHLRARPELALEVRETLAVRYAVEVVEAGPCDCCPVSTGSVVLHGDTKIGAIPLGTRCVLEVPRG